MTQLQSDTMTTTLTQRRAWPIRLLRAMPHRDRTDCVVSYAMMLAAVIVDIFVIATASWAGWPVWAWVLACLPALCAYLTAYATWYRRRAPAAAGTAA